MAIIKKIIVHYLAMLIILPLLFWKCANQMAPGGGEVDKFPPEIIETIPQNGTINFQDQSVDFVFSEYIDKSSIFDAIFISPTVEGGIEYEWSGKTLSMNFEQPLQKNITYTITIGTNLADLNNKNKMKSAFNLTFSTGNKIDKGIIKGKVFTDNPENIMIYAYAIDSINIDPTVDKPKYISQIGLNGNYSLSGLANGKYLIFAIKDEFKDLFYNVGTDQFGSPADYVYLTDSDTVKTGVDFLMTVEDSTKPSMVDVTMTDKNHLRIEFNEYIDSSKVSANNFYIFDSTNLKKYDVNYFYKGNAGVKKYFLAFKHALNDKDDYFLVGNNIADMNGNYSNEESLNFVISSKPDTNYAHIIKTATGFKNNVADFNNLKIPIAFDDAIKLSLLKPRIQLYDNKKNNVPIDIVKKDDANLLCIPKFNLKPRAKYSLKINLNFAIDVAGNSLDSIYTYKFKTLSDLYFSGLSGKIANNKSNYPVILLLKNTDKKVESYSNKIKPGIEKFDFERVLPGKYILWAFIDEDSSGTYNYGKINPYEKSEIFSFYPDTLKLRARWPVGDIYLKIVN